MIYEMSVGIYMGTIVALEMGFGFAFGWQFLAFCKDLKEELITLNDFNKMKEKNDAALYCKLCEIVQFHTEIKQLSCNEKFTSDFQK